MFSHLDINLAVCSPEARLTDALVARHSVLAGCVVETGRGQTLVHVSLTPGPRVSRGAGAVEVGDAVCAGPPVLTGRVPALVPVNITVVTSVAVCNN